MAILIRSKALMFVLRDGVTATAPVYQVGPTKWVPFRFLSPDSPILLDRNIEWQEVPDGEVYKYQAEPIKKPIVKEEPLSEQPAQSQGRLAQVVGGKRK